jgi:hypothetical protein
MNLLSSWSSFKKCSAVSVIESGISAIPQTWGFNGPLINLGISPDGFERDAQTVTKRHRRHFVRIEDVGGLIFTEFHGRKRRQLGGMGHNRHDERSEQDGRGGFPLHGRSPYLDLIHKCAGLRPPRGAARVPAAYLVCFRNRACGSSHSSPRRPVHGTCRTRHPASGC